MIFPLIFLVGPTASGKTRLAIELCARLNGEIVSMDSMQIYRTLDIGTAKPTARERELAKHHLIDIKNPDQIYSAAQWANDARAVIEEIRGRGKTPVVVGGTGFYARALLQPETLASAPPDFELRAQLQDELEKHGAQHLHDQLRVLDFAAAQRLETNDTRRVIRAIEVAKSEHFGRPIFIRRQLPEFKPLFFALNWPRELLYGRIEKRIEQMLRDGFIDELQRLDAMNLDENVTAIHSLGYKQMRPVLNDESVFDECLELWKRDTRRYAKRQMTWFRHQLPTQWIDVNDATSWAEIVRHIEIEYSKVRV